MAIKNKASNLELNVKQVIDNSLASMDAETQSKLNQARQAALSHGVKNSAPIMSRLSGFIAASAVALLLVAVVPKLQQAPQNSIGTNQLEQFVMLEEDFDLYNDLEFYEWLNDGSS